MRRLLPLLFLPFLLTTNSAEACLPSGEMDNLAIYLVNQKPQMKKLCNWCLGSALLTESAIQSYDPTTGKITLTKNGSKQFKKSLRQLGGKDKVMGRRFAFIAQGRIAFTGTLVRSTMSRSLTSPVINLDDKALQILPSYPNIDAEKKALPMPVNLKRALLFKEITDRFKGQLKEELKKSAFSEKDPEKIAKLAKTSSDPNFYRAAPLALIFGKRNNKTFENIMSMLKQGQDSQQRINAALALVQYGVCTYNEQKKEFKDYLNHSLISSGSKTLLATVALAVALCHDKDSVRLITKVQSQFKDNETIDLVLRYLKTSSKFSSPYRFGGSH